jgi:outer membrane lipase/esterase
MKTRLATALVFAFSVASGARAGLPFDQMIVFGASYDDAGQFPDPDFGYATGLRFTNIDPATGKRGYSMPEWLALDLGIGRLTPSIPLVIVPRTDTVQTDNINFAVGGYRAEQVLASVTGTQSLAVGPFSSSGPGFLDRLAAGTLSIGPNTLFYSLPAGNDIRDLDDPAQTAATSVQIAAALVDAGARYVVTPLLPKLGSFSESANFDANGRTARGVGRTNAAIAFNTAYMQGLKAIDGNFILIDVPTLFDEVLARPGSFGLATDIDQTTACFNATAVGGPGCVEPAGRGKAAGGDPDEFVFYDGLHPSQVAARAAADLMESVIRAPGQFSLVPEAVLADALAYQNTLDEQFASDRWNRPAQPWRVFASVQGASVDIAEGAAAPGASSDSADLTLGVIRALGNGWQFGASVGAQSSELDVSGAGSGFDTAGLLASAFVGYRCDRWFADAVLTAGKVDVENIERVFAIGQSQQRRESGETEAEVWALAADVGVNLAPAGWALRVGPFLGADYHQLNVGGYAEDGSSSSAMRYAGLDRDSLLGRAGLFADYPWRLGAAQMSLRADVAYAEEFEDPESTVTSVTKNLAAGPWFRMPGQDLDDSGVRASLAVEGVWNSGLRVGLGYRYDEIATEASYLGLNLSYGL